MKITRLLGPGLLLAAPAAFAHSGGDHIHSFVDGLLHPVTGVDHLLAMTAVGLWSAQQGGRRFWTRPAAFVLAMALGGMLGMAGYGGGWVETGIALSVAMLGLMVALATRLPATMGIAACALTAVAHGIAHSSELPSGASATGYAAGFLLATALLHLCGIGLGKLSRQQSWIGRAFGAATTLTGACLLLAA